MKVIVANNLSKTYEVGGKRLKVIDQVSLTVAENEFLVVRGQSGSGKTTLLSLLSGIDKPTSGSVFVDGCDITPLKEDQLAPLRNRTFGFVFQSFHLIPSLTALENVMFPAELCRDHHAKTKAEELLQRVGLLDRRDNLPHQLSGGEKQRVAICRALVNKPRIIFADEPTGNLDSVNGAIILDLLFEFNRLWGTTILLVTHSDGVSERADRVIELCDGRIAG
jgi:putative ABC transport system ATP-binding protein